MGVARVDRGLGEIADRPQALHVVVRGVAVVEHAPQLVVRVGVVPGSQRGHPARQLHVGEHRARVRGQRDAVDLGGQRLGEVRLAAEPRERRLTRARPRLPQRLRGLGRQPPALLEVGHRRVPAPEMDAAPRAQDQRLGEQRQASVGAQAGDRRAEEAGRELLVADRRRRHAVEAHRAPVAVGVGHELGQPLDHVRARVDRVRPGQDRDQPPVVRVERQAAGDLDHAIAHVGARVAPPAAHRGATEQGDRERGVAGERLLGDVGQRPRRRTRRRSRRRRSSRGSTSRARGPAPRAAASPPRRAAARRDRGARARTPAPRRAAGERRGGRGRRSAAPRAPAP